MPIHIQIHILRGVSKIKALRFLVVCLLMAVCFSACVAGETGDAPIPYDEDYGYAPYYDYGYNGESYADESYDDTYDSVQPLPPVNEDLFAQGFSIYTQDCHFNFYYMPNGV